MNIYEMFGRLAEAEQVNREALDGIKNLIKDLKTGVINIDNIEIDDKGIRIKQDGAT